MSRVEVISGRNDAGIGAKCRSGRLLRKGLRLVHRPVAPLQPELLSLRPVHVCRDAKARPLAGRAKVTFSGHRDNCLAAALMAAPVSCSTGRSAHSQ